MADRVVNFGVIGCGLMGRAFVSAAARWGDLLDLDLRPRVVAACDVEPAALEWFRRAVPDLRVATDYRVLLAAADVEALYIAVPHDRHEEIYLAALAAGKHFLGEKP